MNSIRPVSAPPLVAAADSPARSVDTIENDGRDRPLSPAVSLNISLDAGKVRSAETERRGFERDLDSQAVVYRVTDTVSGDVIVQIPNEIIVKARVYGREQNPPVGERVEKRA